MVLVELTLRLGCDTSGQRGPPPPDYWDIILCPSGVQRSVSTTSAAGRRHFPFPSSIFISTHQPLLHRRPHLSPPAAPEPQCRGIALSATLRQRQDYRDPARGAEGPQHLPARLRPHLCSRRHSRRLQNKARCFRCQQYLCHNRLTHSIEVATVGARSPPSADEDISSPCLSPWASNWSR